MHRSFGSNKPLLTDHFQSLLLNCYMPREEVDHILRTYKCNAVFQTELSDKYCPAAPCKRLLLPGLEELLREDCSVQPVAFDVDYEDVKSTRVAVLSF